MNPDQKFFRSIQEGWVIIQFAVRSHAPWKSLKQRGKPRRRTSGRSHGCGVSVAARKNDSRRIATHRKPKNFQSCSNGVTMRFSAPLNWLKWLILAQSVLSLPQIKQINNGLIGQVSHQHLLFTKWLLRTSFSNMLVSLKFSLSVNFLKELLRSGYPPHNVSSFSLFYFFTTFTYSKVTMRYRKVKNLARQLKTTPNQNRRYFS